MSAFVRATASRTAEVDFTSIDDVTRNVILLAANTNRLGVRIVNRSNQAIPIREGTAATPLLYSEILPPRGELVLDGPVFTAAIYGYFGTLPDGRILVTERT